MQSCAKECIIARKSRSNLVSRRCPGEARIPYVFQTSKNHHSAFEQRKKKNTSCSSPSSSLLALSQPHPGPERGSQLCLYEILYEIHIPSADPGPKFVWYNGNLTESLHPERRPRPKICVVQRESYIKSTPRAPTPDQNLCSTTENQCKIHTPSVDPESKFV